MSKLNKLMAYILLLNNRLFALLKLLSFQRMYLLFCHEEWTDGFVFSVALEQSEFQTYVLWWIWFDNKNIT